LKKANQSALRSRSHSTSPSVQHILVGPAGWSYHDWNGIVYPSRNSRRFYEAAYLAEFFDTIEINTSFYQPLRPVLAAQWVAQVAFNPRFLFTAKLWQKITHEGNTTSADESAVRRGFDVLCASGKLGAVLLQFPFSFHRMPENIARLSKILKAFASYPLAVEVRHATWSAKEFYEFLHERRVGLCNIDQPLIGRSVKPTSLATSATGYVRLHGRRYDTWFRNDPASPPSERYNYLYSEEELEPWAGRIRRIAEHTQTTFVVTNNHYQGKAIVNALQLIHLLTKNKIKVPEPLRSHYPQLNAIASEPEKEPTLFPLSTN
jgi:uncharacterized protein YecE (DUF72 family)